MIRGCHVCVCVQGSKLRAALLRTMRMQDAALAAGAQAISDKADATAAGTAAARASITNGSAAALGGVADWRPAGAGTGGGGTSGRATEQVVRNPLSAGGAKVVA
jgi:hypothetical protein